MKTLLCVLLMIPCAAPGFPSRFTGEWRDELSSDAGTMEITVTSVLGHRVNGRMLIRGSRHCGSPINFAGVGSEARFTVESEDSVVCGYHGKLLGEVVRVAHERYQGTFTYRFLGGVWAKGTFAVRSLEGEEGK